MRKEGAGKEKSPMKKLLVSTLLVFASLVGLYWTATGDVALVLGLS